MLQKLLEVYTVVKSVDWNQVIQAYLMLVGAISLFVKAVPYLEKNSFVQKVMAFLGKYVAVNKDPHPQG